MERASCQRLSSAQHRINFLTLVKKRLIVALITVATIPIIITFTIVTMIDRLIKRWSTFYFLFEPTKLRPSRPAVNPTA